VARRQTEENPGGPKPVKIDEPAVVMGVESLRLLDE
jgi:hypothetical protein